MKVMYSYNGYGEKVLFIDGLYWKYKLKSLFCFSNVCYLDRIIKLVLFGKTVWVSCWYKPNESGFFWFTILS